MTLGSYAKIPELLSILLRWHADPVAAAFPRFDGSLEYEPWSSTAVS